MSTTLDEAAQQLAEAQATTQPVCPHCKYDGTSEPDDSGSSAPFYYLEDIVCHRNVIGIRDGKLIMEGHFETGEGYDDGTNPRLECRNCLNEFPIPDRNGAEGVCGGELELETDFI